MLVADAVDDDDDDTWPVQSLEQCAVMVAVAKRIHLRRRLILLEQMYENRYQASWVLRLLHRQIRDVFSGHERIMFLAFLPASILLP